MYTLAKIIQYFFPLIALILLIIGIKRKMINYIISSLWICIIALLIHYQFSGYQIFGVYFDFMNASIYTFTMIVLIMCLIKIISHLSIDKLALRYLTSFINAVIVIGAGIVIINLWLNAFFIESKKPNTPIMQIASTKKLPYCDYKFVLYKITPEDKVMYLCPDYYGLLAGVGTLNETPSFLMHQYHLVPS